MKAEKKLEKENRNQLKKRVKVWRKMMIRAQLLTSDSGQRSNSNFSLIQATQKIIYDGQIF
jgi:hypothetical protein